MEEPLILPAKGRRGFVKRINRFYRDFPVLIFEGDGSIPYTTLPFSYSVRSNSTIAERLRATRFVAEDARPWEFSEVMSPGVTGRIYRLMLQVI
jgi:hypothetical protein